MKHSLKIRITALLSLLSIWGCSRNCTDSVYEMTSMDLTPRSLTPQGGVGSWDNANELPVTRLMIRLDMEKTYLSQGEEGIGCFPKDNINNRATEMRVTSNQSFNSTYSAGENLTDICLFTVDSEIYISPFDFLDGYFNESGYREFYMVFNLNPEAQALHNLRMQIRFGDGSRLEAELDNILITPVPPAE